MPTRVALLSLIFAAVACGDSGSSADRSRPPTTSTDPAARSRLATRFVPPSGFARVPVESGSFAGYLRELELRTDRDYVLTHAGDRVDSASAAVATLGIGTRDLQQCADSIMRLHAEWSWATGRADEVAYHFVSGDVSRWKDWREGERFRIRGSAVDRVRTARPDDSHDNFERYLFHVFAYAGTASMARDSSAVPIHAARPGDFFVQPGSPGHAVVILDLAEHPDGRRVALLGQGFMPAQDFHVIAGSGEAVLARVWFTLPTDEHGIVATPSWRPFAARHLRRFRHH